MTAAPAIRKENDAYHTPQALADAICNRLKERIGTPDLIIEPSAGTGAFVKAARKTWHRDPFILAVEPHEATYSYETCADSVYDETWEETIKDLRAGPPILDQTLVVGNPPYNLPGDGHGGNPTTAERHIHLALDLLPSGAWAAFLLRASFVAGQGRYKRLYEDHPLKGFWPVLGRPSFTNDGKTDQMEYAVFFWQKDYRGPVDLEPLEWK